MRWLGPACAVTLSGGTASRGPRPVLGRLPCGVPGRRYRDAVEELAPAAGAMSAKAMDDRTSHLREAADIPASAARRIWRSS